MAICKGIVAAHGGLMGLESVVDRGTTVTINLRADLSAPACGGGKNMLGTGMAGLRGEMGISQ